MMITCTFPYMTGTRSLLKEGFLREFTEEAGSKMRISAKFVQKTEKNGLYMTECS